MRIVIIGAGAVGRGLIGKAFSNAGNYVCFVDKNDDLARALWQGGDYLVNDGITTQIVAPITARRKPDLIDREIARADVIFVSVRVENLADVAETLARGLTKRKTHCDIIVIENMNAAGYELKEMLKERISDSLISCFSGIAEATIPEVPSDLAELDSTYCYTDARAWLVLPDALRDRAWVRNVDELVFAEDFAFAWDLKWYLHCALHALVAYTGLAHNYVYISEVLDNNELRQQIDGIMQIVVLELSRQYPNRWDEIADRLDSEIALLVQPDLLDTCARVARDAKRKILPGERLDALLKMTGEQPILMLAIKQARKTAEEQ